MTKTQFITLLAEHTGNTQTVTEKFVNSYAEVVTAALKAEGEMTIPGLVKLGMKEKAAQPEKVKKNPFTGQMMTVKAKPASKKVTAKAIAALKKAVG